MAMVKVISNSYYTANKTMVFASFCFEEITYQNAYWRPQDYIQDWNRSTELL